jgi:hypothetical protein
LACLPPRCCCSDDESGSQLLFGLQNSTAKRSRRTAVDVCGVCCQWYGQGGQCGVVTVSGIGSSVVFPRDWVPMTRFWFLAWGIVHHVPCTCCPCCVVLWPVLVHLFTDTCTATVRHAIWSWSYVCVSAQGAAATPLACFSLSWVLCCLLAAPVSWSGWQGQVACAASTPAVLPDMQKFAPRL